MNIRKLIIGFSFLLIVPVTGSAVQATDQPGSNDQRAACDARCREDYQNNPSALQACIRDCGAIGPASSSQKTINTTKSNTFKSQPAQGVLPAAETTVKSSKSNSSERLGSPPAPPPGAPAEASNLNLSKSNINREAPEPEEGAEPSTDSDE